MLLAGGEQLLHFGYTASGKGTEAGASVGGCLKEENMRVLDIWMPKSVFRNTMLFHND